MAEGVADLSRLFVVFLSHRFIQGVFEAFTFGERALQLDLLQPGFQGMDFAALFQQVVAGMLAVKSPEFLQAGFDHRDGVRVFVVAQRLHASGADLHHEQLGAELLERPGQLV